MGIRGNSKESMKTSESSAVSLLAMRARNQRWLPDVFVLPRGSRDGAHDMRWVRHPGDTRIP